MSHYNNVKRHFHILAAFNKKAQARKDFKANEASRLARLPKVQEEGL